MRTKVNLLLLAFRNLSRHKVKTVLTILAIAVGVALFNWMDAWLLGCNLDSKRNLVNFETGSAKIYSKAYFDKKDELPLYEGFDDYMPIIKQLNESGYNAAPHAVFTGSLMSKDQELPFMFVGIDPELEKTVLKYNEFLEPQIVRKKESNSEIKESQFVENGLFETIIGVRGAKNLNVTIGDKVRCSVTIDIKDEKGKVRHVHQIIDLKIRGIVNSLNPKINGNIAFLPLDILQDEMGVMLEGKITEIIIRKKDVQMHELPSKEEKPEYILNKMGNNLPSHLVLVGWQEDAKDYLAISAGDTIPTYIMTGLLLLLAIIGITNTMLMAIFERTKEIGMLRALGMKNGEIIKLFLYEAGLIGFFGSILGLILAMPLDIWIIYWGVDYTKFMEEANMHEMGYRIVGIFRGAWNYLTIAASPVVGTIVALLAALWPAVKSTKMSISDTLRFE